MAQELEKLYSVEEAATYLGISPATLRSWVALRQIDVCKIGRRVVIPASTLAKTVIGGMRGADPERLKARKARLAASRAAKAPTLPSKADGEAGN
jgi:excisionase family DNA binding protein